MDQYKIEQINKHIKAMDNDEYYMAYLIGPGAKTITLNKDALEVLKAYYSEPEHIESSMLSGITLLTVEEAKALPRKMASIGHSWWLRSPGYRDDHTAVVHCNGYVNDDGRDVFAFELGVRPALILNRDSDLEAGCSFSFADHDWTVIEGGKALCNDTIGNSIFSSKDNSNYEKSDIKAYLENWARENGIISTEMTGKN